MNHQIAEDGIDHSTSDPSAAVAELIRAAGVHGLRFRRVLAMLLTDWQSLDDVIRGPAMPRRTVEELLSAVGDDLARRSVDGRELFRIPAPLADEYRRRFALAELPAPVEPVSASVELPDSVRSAVRADIAEVPPPLAALDHVQATPDSVLRRAAWLTSQYELDGAEVLFLGDHDLTSLALAGLRPELSITVVDVDDRVLAHIDRIAEARGLRVRCLHADLRFGLPPSVLAGSDLVFTDPPYTPEGIGLFAARAVECLRDSGGRVLIAYGYSDRTPALGFAVQQRLQRLGMLFEAIVPDFDRYEGAQAVGSASDLYVCRPVGSGKSARRGDNRIYTHGPQSSESGGTLSEAALDALQRLVAPAGGSTSDDAGPQCPLPVSTADWSAPSTTAAAVIDAQGDPGPWLSRVLAATNAQRLAVLVRNNHPDLVDAAAQQALRELVAAKYSLRFHRSTPDGKHAVVVATSATGETASPAGALLRKAHGRIANVWREALVQRESALGRTLTKNQARDLVRATAPRAEELDLRLIDLPRHRIAAVLAAADATPTGPGDVE
ncbi:bis-aminopropyl spermidine synthase family protein [Actinoalloteichus hymeniacidonis]|uniref:N(4)-bis(aminopropyl)spermidine synthase C-terminal domain-containing protein n=1 Tax=Actinoalloteichus hymeniacidonis TaxID=340345 RepID=A0AAC9HTP7_9PSEU|nr:bis-aminopropyl spermidine synthase family protein [Actinoalloteichus hymeniacidonis]AOS65404.1 Protein of unknown function DUF43 [Actinoalloteichus hymeniacidonis]MBB5906510.1 hypothetical protein [Actinoalloteichus hymeniacidonis]